jgi:hypothetical protein
VTLGRDEQDAHDGLCAPVSPESCARA